MINNGWIDGIYIGMHTFHANTPAQLKIYSKNSVILSLLLCAVRRVISLNADVRYFANDIKVNRSSTRQSLSFNKQNFQYRPTGYGSIHRSHFSLCGAQYPELRDFYDKSYRAQLGFGLFYHKGCVAVGYMLGILFADSNCP